MPSRAYSPDTSVSGRVRARAAANAEAAEADLGSGVRINKPRAAAAAAAGTGMSPDNPLLRWLPPMGMLVFQLSPELRIYEAEPGTVGATPFGESLFGFVDVVDRVQFESVREWCAHNPGQPHEISARLRDDENQTQRRGWLTGMAANHQLIGFTLTLIPDASATQAMAATPTQLRRIDALANAGFLASSVAHDIATPLTQARLTLSQTLRQLATIGVDDETRAMLDAVSNSIADACYMSRRLTRVAAPLTPTPPTPCDLHMLLDGVLALVSGGLKERAVLIRNYEELPRVLAEPQKLKQLFTNLIVNAIQAIPVGDPMANLLTVEMVDAGATLTVTISDTGQGIPTQDLDRIFEPFFTSKAETGGTGLGLSVCRRVVDELGGSIRISSVPHQGTTVDVTLPTYTL